MKLAPFFLGENSNSQQSVLFKHRSEHSSIQSADVSTITGDHSILFYYHSAISFPVQSRGKDLVP